MRPLTRRDLLISGFVIALCASAVTEGCVYARLKSIDETNVEIQTEQAAQQKALEPATKMQHDLDLAATLLAQLQAETEQSKALCRVRVLVQVHGLKQFEPGNIEQCADAVDEVLTNVIKSSVCNEEGYLHEAAAAANTELAAPEKETLKNNMAACGVAANVDAGLKAVDSAFKIVQGVVDRLRSRANASASRIESLRAEIKRLTAGVGQRHYLAFTLQIIGLAFALMKDLRAKD